MTTSQCALLTAIESSVKNKPANNRMSKQRVNIASSNINENIKVTLSSTKNDKKIINQANTISSTSSTTKVSSTSTRNSRRKQKKVLSTSKNMKTQNPDGKVIIGKEQLPGKDACSNEVATSTNRNAEVDSKFSTGNGSKVKPHSSRTVENSRARKKHRNSFNGRSSNSGPNHCGNYSRSCYADDLETPVGNPLSDDEDIETDPDKIHPYEQLLDDLRMPEHMKNCEYFSVKPWFKTPCIIVATRTFFLKVLENLARQKIIGVTIKANDLSYYSSRICLLQISTRRRNYLIDAIELSESLHLLNDIFASPKIVKVIFGCHRFFKNLQLEHSIWFVNVFDIRIAMRTLGWKSISFKSFVEMHFHVEWLRGDMGNWHKRPLRKDYRMNATISVHYLLPVYLTLKNEFNRIENNKSLLEYVFRESNEQCYVVYRPKSVEAMFPALRHFEPSKVHVILALEKWRQNHGRRKNKNVELILSKHDFKELMKFMPIDKNRITQIANSEYVAKDIDQIYKIMLEAHDVIGPVCLMSTGNVKPIEYVIPAANFKSVTDVENVKQIHDENRKSTIVQKVNSIGSFKAPENVKSCACIEVSNPVKSSGDEILSKKTLNNLKENLDSSQVVKVTNCRVKSFENVKPVHDTESVEIRNTNKFESNVLQNVNSLDSLKAPENVKSCEYVEISDPKKSSENESLTIDEKSLNNLKDNLDPLQEIKLIDCSVKSVENVKLIYDTETVSDKFESIVLQNVNSCGSLKAPENVKLCDHLEISDPAKTSENENLSIDETSLNNLKENPESSQVVKLIDYSVKSVENVKPNHDTESAENRKSNKFESTVLHNVNSLGSLKEAENVKSCKYAEISDPVKSFENEKLSIDETSLNNLKENLDPLQVVKLIDYSVKSSESVENSEPISKMKSVENGKSDKFTSTNSAQNVNSARSLRSPENVKSCEIIEINDPVKSSGHGNHFVIEKNNVKKNIDFTQDVKLIDENMNSFQIMMLPRNEESSSNIKCNENMSFRRNVKVAGKKSSENPNLSVNVKPAGNVRFSKSVKSVETGSFSENVEPSDNVKVSGKYTANNMTLPEKVNSMESTNEVVKMGLGNKVVVVKDTVRKKKNTSKRNRRKNKQQDVIIVDRKLIAKNNSESVNNLNENNNNIQVNVTDQKTKDKNYKQSNIYEQINRANKLRNVKDKRNETRIYSNRNVSNDSTLRNLNNEQKMKNRTPRNNDSQRNNVRNNNVLRNSGCENRNMNREAENKKYPVRISENQNSDTRNTKLNHIPESTNYTNRMDEKRQNRDHNKYSDADRPLIRNNRNSPDRNHANIGPVAQSNSDTGEQYVSSGPYSVENPKPSVDNVVAPRRCDDGNKHFTGYEPHFWGHPNSEVDSWRQPFMVFQPQPYYDQVETYMNMAPMNIGYVHQNYYIGPYGRYSEDGVCQNVYDETQVNTCNNYGMQYTFVPPRNSFQPMPDVGHPDRTDHGST